MFLSQSIGMLGELAAEFPSIAAIFAKASEILGLEISLKVKMYLLYST